MKISLFSAVRDANISSGVITAPSSLLPTIRLQFQCIPIRQKMMSNYGEWNGYIIERMFYNINGAACQIWEEIFIEFAEHIKEGGKSYLLYMN